MTPCSCGVTSDPVIVGIQRDYNDVPAYVLWNCSKGSTHAIPIGQASDALLRAAHEIDYVRRIGEGLG